MLKLKLKLLRVWRFRHKREISFLRQCVSPARVRLVVFLFFGCGEFKFSWPAEYFVDFQEAGICR